MIQNGPLNPDTAIAVEPDTKGYPSLVYSSPRVSVRYPVTNTLPIGAQSRLMKAARFSEKIGCPVNTLLTVNAEHLQRLSSDGVFGIGHLWDGMQGFIELARKWTVARGIPWVVIWSREYAGGKHGQSGEHWHLGLHLPQHMHGGFAEQVARWTDAPTDNTSKATTIAQSFCRSWHFRTRAPRGRGAEGLAAYLGKSEPSWIRRYGRSVPNKRKPERWQNGGTGPIQGKRFGISKAIGATAQYMAV